MLSERGKSKLWELFREKIEIKTFIKSLLDPIFSQLTTDCVKCIHIFRDRNLLKIYSPLTKRLSKEKVYMYVLFYYENASHDLLVKKLCKYNIPTAINGVCIKKWISRNKLTFNANNEKWVILCVEYLLCSSSLLTVDSECGLQQRQIVTEDERTSQ